MLVLLIVVGGIYAGGLVVLAFSAASAPIGEEGDAGFEEGRASGATEPQELPASRDSGALMG